MRSNKQLARILSQEEINYCMSNQHKSAERFAARFAVREAFYKALLHYYPTKKFPLLTVCRALNATKAPNGSGIILVDWALLNIPADNIHVHVSWAHSATTATAMVILEQR
jgi:phosphopantetheine--protein transferase-like protein